MDMKTWLRRMIAERILDPIPNCLLTVHHQSVEMQTESEHGKHPNTPRTALNSPLTTHYLASAPPAPPPPP